MAILISVCVLQFLLFVYADKMNFEIHVLEKQSRFVQKVQTDLNTNHVYYATPAHNDVVESHRMQDFKQNIQITCLPTMKECYLTKIDKSNYPDAGNTTESIVHMWNKGINSIIDATADQVSHKLILSGKEILNTAFLSQNMRDMVTRFGFPLYVAKPIPTDAKFGQFPPGEIMTSTNHSMKRETINESPIQCGSKAPEFKYGFTTAEHCDHLFLCKSTPKPTMNGITCGDKHIHTNLFYKCLCCPGYLSLSDRKHCQCFRFDA